MTSIEMKVTSGGVLIPRTLLAAWGDVEEVEIEQCEDAILIRRKSQAHRGPVRNGHGR